MKPHVKKLKQIRNLLTVIADTDSKVPVVLGHVEVKDYLSCQTYRCVLGWYNHFYRPEDPYIFSIGDSRKQFGVDPNTYEKIFGPGSDATEDPNTIEFNEDQTRREIRRRIKIVDRILETV